MTGFCLNGILKNTTSHRSVDGFRAVRPAWRPLSERNPEVNVESI